MSATLLDDIRWAVRYARRRPVFALVVSVTLAISIATATTAFGLATAVLWRPLPFQSADQLVFLWEEVERDGQRQASRVTGSRYAAWRDTTSGLAAISLFGSAGFTIEGEGHAASVSGVRVSANYFDTLGVRAVIGRTFTAADETPGDHRVVILSNGFWRERMGGRGDVVGETIRLSGQPHTIVGVMPPVTFPAWPVNPAVVTLDPDARQFWVPISRTPALERSGTAHVFGVLARLAPGVTDAEVVDRLNSTSEPASIDRHRARLMPMREQFVSAARAPLLALTGAALALLIIACANLAALYVSAFESRRGELALRIAIGAGVSRIARQLAIEAMLLAAAGAFGGMMLAGVALDLVPGLLPPTIPFLTMPILDLRVAGLAAILAVAASLMLIGWPIARVITTAPAPRGLMLGSRQGVYRVLVVAQIAVTVALVSVAALLGQSLQSVQRRDPGFTLDRVFVANIGLPVPHAASAESVSVAELRLLDAIRRRPNVEAVAAAYDHPLEANWSESPTLVGDTTAPDQQRSVELRIVSPGYFDAIDVAVLEGRTFVERDNFSAPGVAMVNEAFAREAGGRVLGRRLRSGTPRFRYGNGAPNEFEIVGIVDNERFRGLEQPVQAAFYLSTRQFPQAAFSVIARTAGDPMTIAPDIRAAIRDTDPGITFDRPASLDAILADQLVPRRVTTDVIGGFAAAALALAALGIYGLLAVLVGNRKREIGVRLAIGASPATVAWRVVTESLGNAAIGVTLGCILAVMAGRFVQSLLVGVTGRDPLTLVVVGAVLFTVALVAAVLPARRAARIDPVDALRAE